MAAGEARRAAEVAGAGEYEGELFKRPTSLTAYLSWSGWRRRYCLADDDELRYFGRKGDAVPRGVVKFAEGCRVRNRGLLDPSQRVFAFDLEYQGEVLTFGSTNQADINTWVAVLEQKIRRAALRTGKLMRRAASSFSSVPSSALSAPSGPMALDAERESVNNPAEWTSRRSDAGSDAASSAALASYGTPPAGFKFLRYERLAPSVCATHEGWRLQRLGYGMRVFELENPYAGNSATDLNGIVADTMGPVELKSCGLIPAPTSHVFAMLMDLSRSRKRWDSSFSAAKVLRVLDLHTDIICIRLAPLISRVTAPRAIVLRRYWCRQADGAYIIYCTSVDVGDGDDYSDLPEVAGKGFAAGAVLTRADLLFATIVPGQNNSPDPVCNVTLGARLSLGGWLGRARPLVRMQVERMLAVLEPLNMLAATRPVNFGDGSGTDSPQLAFPCELADALASAGVNLYDDDSLLGSLRDTVEATRDRTGYERALDRARAHLAEEPLQPHSGPRSGPLSNSTKVEGGSRQRVGPEEDSDGPALQRRQGSTTSIALGTGEARGAQERTLNYDYAVPRNNYLLPMAISKEGVSAWWDSGVEEGYWNVRGPNYLEDRVKVPNQVSAMELLQMQWSFFDTPKRNIARDPQELVQLQHVGRKDRPFMLVINFMVPSIGNWACYFVKRRSVQDPKFDSMLDQFVNGDDEYRNSRFKIIPSVVEGSYLAKRGIGSTPAILGKKIKTEYFAGDNWFEICVDVSSSRVAGSLMSLVKSYAKTLVIDLAFLFESQSKAELPERILGGARMHLPLMEPIKDLHKYAKSPEALEQAYVIPPELHGAGKAAEVGASKSAAKNGPAKADSVPTLLPVPASPLSSFEDAEDGDEATTPESHASEGMQPREENGDDELDYRYKIPENNYLVPIDLAKNKQSAWWDSGNDVGFWKLRGPNYLSDKVKVPNEVSSMEVVQMQWSFYDKPKRHISADPDELVQLEHAGRTDRPFLFVVNFMVPGIGNWTCYFAKRRGVEDARFNRMLDAFIEGDDEYRNSRFKIIPNIVEGYFMVRKAVGSRPAILGRKINTEYFRGDNYFEVCVDVGSSSIAERLMGVVRQYASTIVIDLAFLFEGQAEDELPERLLGGARIYYPLMYAVSREELHGQYYTSVPTGSP